MGFEACHPAVNLIYFAAVLTGMIGFKHPVFLGISFACAFAYSVRRNRWKAVIFNGLLIPLTVLFAFYYAGYHHFGMTELGVNFVGNRITLESLVYGLVIGFVVAGVMIWMSCVYSVFTTDKVVYLFGKVSPRLSLALAVLLRLVPRIKAQARKINTARRGIGRGTDQGNFFRRLVNRICSSLCSSAGPSGPWTRPRTPCAPGAASSGAGRLFPSTASTTGTGPMSSACSPVSR